MSDEDLVKRRPILAAIDFSPCSDAALEWAASESRRHRAPLIVLHVVHDPSDAPGSYRRAADSGDGDDTGAGTGAETMESVADRYLRDFIDEFGKSNDDIHHVGVVATRLVVGLPATRILEVARDEGAGQIIMGSRGRTGIAHLLVGSIAQRVVQLSPIPVTIVKAQQHPSADSAQESAS